MRFIQRSLGQLLAIATLAFTGNASAQITFGEYGQLVSGSGCALFSDSFGREFPLDIDESGQSFGVDLRVTGTLNLPCSGLCVIGDGCITGAVIGPCIALPPLHPDHCSGNGGEQMECTSCSCGNDIPPGAVGGCASSTGAGHASSVCNAQ